MNLEILNLEDLIENSCINLKPGKKIILGKKKIDRIKDIVKNTQGCDFTKSNYTFLYNNQENYYEFEGFLFFIV